MNIRSYLTLCALSLCTLLTHGQEPADLLVEKETALAAEFDKIRQSSVDYVRAKANERILAHFEAVLALPESFDYPFEQLAISKLLSDDGRVRVINWNLPTESGKQTYYAFVQYRNGTKYRVSRLTDASDEIPQPEALKLSHDRWYGALYYEIITVESDGRRYYTLLGWDGYDYRMNQKVIEIMALKADGTPVFGADLFEATKGRPKRIVLRYAAQAKVNLRYEARKRRIVFDRLAPVKPQFAGVYEFYGPDVATDAFVLHKGKWRLDTLVDVRNEKQPERKPELKYSTY